ncbi:hypothetical protein AnigIFM62618_011199 [Aspergillus niger]|nr:hypothetical protein AnigIFM62618_011199 [Aspergillus niger]
MPAARRDVRGTVWFGRTRPPVVSTQHAATITNSDHVPSNQAFSRATSGLNCLPPQQFAPNPAPREILAQSPWEVYEPRACIYYGRIMVLARHQKNKATLVHIQMQAVERSAIEMCVQMIDRLAHRSIPRLLDVFQELASLTPRDILFTEEGEIKIAGIENSRQVDPSRADAMTSTFNALRSILDKIMQKNGPNFTWSQEIRSLKSALAKSTSARCLDRLVQVSWLIFQPRHAMWQLTRKHTFFEQVTGEGGLKVLVDLANKTIFHEITFPPEDSLAKTGPRGKPVEPSTT